MLTEPQIARLGMTIGLGALVLYMGFIILQIARESQAGRMGGLVLFLVLGFGVLGFLSKSIIQWVLEH